MSRKTREQILPLILTIFTFFALCFLFYWVILILNLFPIKEKNRSQLRIQDVIVGLTIYLKTSIDFAIFIGNLMNSNPGWQKRIAIELGTAVGNALGTILIFVIWNFFREIPILMVVMITIASLVLLRMAEESLGDFLLKNVNSPLSTSVSICNRYLGQFNHIFTPILRLFIPTIHITNTKTRGFVSLVCFALTIPLILGLDDFAGYIPLFSIVNVFGFAVGIFLGHMLLNLGLFLFPQKTTRIVKSPLIMILGGIAFIGIALWGFTEAIQLLIRMV